MAWMLKVWSGLMIRSGGRNTQHIEQASVRRRKLWIEIAT